MAKTRDYMDYLDESIGIAPAHSQEEYQASEVISQIMEEHGLQTMVEEFDSAGTGVMARNVLAIVLFVTLLVAGLVPGTLHVIMLLVALASAGLLTFMRFVRNIFENIGPARRSQNVVAVRRARNQEAARTSRPIVIVAHYDTPREEPMYRGVVARYQSLLVRVGVFCPAIVCVAVLFQILAFLPEGFRMFMWVAGLIACLPAVVLAVTSLMGRFGNCTMGANNNKSSVAALLTMVDKVSPAEDRATTAAKSRPRPHREVRLQETPEIEPVQRTTQTVEEVKGVRHGEEVLRSLGILPASCEITYEEPRVIVEDKNSESEGILSDEGMDEEIEPKEDRYDDYDEFDEDADDYEDDFEDEYEEDSDDWDDEEDAEDEDEAPKRGRRLVSLPAPADDVDDEDDEYDDDELIEDDEDYDEDYDDEYDEDYDDEEDDENASIGTSIGEWFSSRIGAIKARFGSSDKDESDDWMDEEDEDDYDEDYEDELIDEDDSEDFAEDEEETEVEDESYDDEEEFEEEDYVDEYFDEDEEDSFDSDEDYEEDPDADFEEYDDELLEDDEEELEEEYEEQETHGYDEYEEDPDAAADLARDAELEEEYASDFEYDEDEDELYPRSSFEPIDVNDDEEFEEDEDEDVQPIPPKRRPLFGRLLRRRSIVADEPEEPEDEDEYLEDDDYLEDENSDEYEEGFLDEEETQDELLEEEDFEDEYGEEFIEDDSYEDDSYEDDSCEDDSYEDDSYEDDSYEDEVDESESKESDSDDDELDEEYDYSEQPEYDDEDELYEEEYSEDDEYEDDYEYEDEDDQDYYYEEDELDEEPVEEIVKEKGPSLGQRILGLFRGNREQNKREQEYIDEESDEYFLEEEEYDEEYDGDYYEEESYEGDDNSQDAYVADDDEAYDDEYLEDEDYIEEYDESYEYEDESYAYEDLSADEYEDDDALEDEVEPAIEVAPVRPPDPNMLHFDREEDDDILERDDSGINTITDNYDLLEGEISRESRRARPAAIDDPTWGTSTYQPTRPSLNIARRAALYDLPDPSGATVDPLEDEYEYTEDVPATQEEAERSGSRGGFWGDDASSQRSSEWKGGATLRDDLRDDPYAIGEDELKDAMLDMGDDYLDEHDIWFVATGASEAEHGGMKAFLDTHRRDIRGAFLINLECVGSGTLSVYVREGLVNRRRADRRLVRLINEIARDLHINMDTAMCDWTETDAATAMRARVRAATIVGLDDNDLPALSHTVDDVPENVNPKQVYDVVRIVTELIRRS